MLRTPRAEFQTFLENRGRLVDVAWGALARASAGAHAMQGDTGWAHPAYRGFPTLQKGADPGIPSCKRDNDLGNLAGNFVAVTSSVVTETVEDFALTVPTDDPTSVTLSAGGTANYTVNVAPSNAQTFLSAITLTVSGTPPGAAATFTPSSLAANAAGQDVALKIQVSSQTAPIHSSGLLLKLSPVMAGIMLLPFGGKIRRAAGQHRRAVRLLLLLLAMTSVAGISACGGGPSGPKVKTYTLTVTAASGSLSHSTNLTLTVQ